jgi:hypothetical protein
MSICHYMHTHIVDDFCDRLSLYATVRHCTNAVNYPYHFNMKHFSLLDFFFVLSSTLFDKAGDRVSMVDDTDNLSDRDPVFLTLQINSPTVFLILNGHAGTHRKAFTAQVGGGGAAALGLYRTVLADNLTSIALPVEAISCHDVLLKMPRMLRRLIGVLHRSLVHVLPPQTLPSL